MAPQPSEKMTVALRILNAIMASEQPDYEDISRLRLWAPNEEFHNSPDELARATIKRELALPPGSGLG
jgi:hypothetical protein